MPQLAGETGIFIISDRAALRISVLTFLDTVPWADGAEKLMEALNAQAQAATRCWART